MTTEEFWDKYINEDILQIFDIACNFFSQELPRDFIENYDVAEVILEVKGHQETAKNFANVLQFIEILQKYQPKLYKEYFQYFDDFLVDYFCFHQDELKVKQSFSNFIKDPLHDYDIYLPAFKKILFYQHSELLKHAISKNFALVNESDDLIGNAEYDLAICKFHMLLQEIYNGQKERLDKDAFSSALSEFNFKFEDDFLSAIETGIVKPHIEPDKLRDLFQKDKKSTIIILEGYFLRYMYEKGFEFYLSGKIWDEMLAFWQENNYSKKTIDTYFNIKPSVFEKYLIRVSGDIFLDNRSEMVAMLWGSVYVYDFLHTYHIISEKLFNNVIKVSRALKGIVIGQMTPFLWNWNFVHHWVKPDCISEKEFLEEDKIFRKSISFKEHKFTRLRSEISEELSKIGELSDFIIEGGKEKAKLSDTIPAENLFSLPREDATDYNNDNVVYEPIRTEKRVGRNEPCPCGSGKKYKKCCGKTINH